jgi:CsoR family transcriptional regulator, copper-sensing transcriptional repressor
MSEPLRPIVRRLRTIGGHIQAVERMVEEDKYCIDIVHQTQAIKRALDKVEEELLREHVAGCIATAVRGDDPAERERVLGELLDLFGAANQR